MKIKHVLILVFITALVAGAIGYGIGMMQMLSKMRTGKQVPRKTRDSSELKRSVAAIQKLNLENQRNESSFHYPSQPREISDFFEIGRSEFDKLPGITGTIHDDSVNR